MLYDVAGSDLNQRLVLVLLGAGLGVGPQLVDSIAGILSLTGSKGILVQHIDSHSVVGLRLEQAPVCTVHHADNGLVIPFIRLCQHQVGHRLLNFHTFLRLVVGRAGGCIVTVGQVADGGNRAHEHQADQSYDLLLVKLHIHIGTVHQFGPAADGQQEAYEMGMVNKVVPLERLEDEVVEWAETMMQHSPLALRMIKAGLNAELDGQAGIQELAGDATMLYYLTDEAQEGGKAFLEKRRPRFEDYPKFP